MSRSVVSTLLLALPIGCTAILGIDGDYVVGTQDAGLVAAGGFHATGGAPTGGASDNGGTSSGGRVVGGEPGTGGLLETGGANTGGTSGAAGAPACDTDGSSCMSGQKCCPSPQTGSKSCIDPLPIVGCGEPGCTACQPPPDNAVAICSSGNCDFECIAQFTRNGSVCEPNGTGGAAGAGGGTGTGGTPPVPPCKMRPSPCTGCGLIGPFPCCRSGDSCGCTYAPGAVCY